MSSIQAHTEENWTLVVRPKVNWLDLHLKDVWRYRDLVMMFVRRDFVATYKQTILGPLWLVFQPLCASLLYVFVFAGIARLSTNGTPPVLFYLSGLTVWNYFASCLNKTSGTFTTNSILFGKVYFPRLTVPISIIISGIVTFFIQFAFFLGFLVYYVMFKGIEFHFNIYLLVIPYLIMVMGSMGLGAGLIISSLTKKYRDLANLVVFGVQLLMYLTTVIFPLSTVQGHKKKLLVMANPMTSIIESFRYAFMPNGHFMWNLLGYSSVFALVILVTGVLLFNRTEKSFMDTV